jgi:hypothetical protein
MNQFVHDRCRFVGATTQLRTSGFQRLKTRGQLSGASLSGLEFRLSQLSSLGLCPSESRLRLKLFSSPTFRQFLLLAPSPVRALRKRPTRRQ